MAPRSVLNYDDENASEEVINKSIEIYLQTDFEWMKNDGGMGRGLGKCGFSFTRALVCSCACCCCCCLSILSDSLSLQILLLWHVLGSCHFNLIPDLPLSPNIPLAKWNDLLREDQGAPHNDKLMGRTIKCFSYLISVLSRKEHYLTPCSSGGQKCEMSFTRI